MRTRYLAADSFFSQTPQRDPRLEWAGLARGGTRTFSIEGDHESVLCEPWVDDLAAHLGPVLQGTAARSDG